MFSKLNKCFQRKAKMKKGGQKESLIYIILGKWENARIGPWVIDHFALVLVSLIFEGPSVFVVAGKITTIMPGTFPIFLLSTKKIIVATTTTKASIKIIWKLPQTRSVILLVWYYWCLLKDENRNFCWNLKVTFPMSSPVQ